jgi:CheY-like chemotaxis protein
MEYAPLSITSSIVIIDDDEDDLFILNRIFADFQIADHVRYFTDALKALDYLLEETGMIFVILSDINLPGLTGLELKQRIDQNPVLRQKSIPFVFYSTAATPFLVAEAYRQLTIQGFFQKEDTYDQVKQTLYRILSYWQHCKHPNNG